MGYNLLIPDYSKFLYLSVMRVILLLVASLVLAGNLCAQEQNTGAPVTEAFAPLKKFYFRGFFERNEVPEQQAEFVELVKTGPDSMRSIEIRHIALDQIVLEAFMKNREPRGMWYYFLESGARLLNYDFELDYGTAAPDTSEREFYLPEGVKLKNAMADDSRQSYIAPELATGHASFNEFLSANLVYPYPAMVSQTKGRVLVGLQIDEEGRVSNIRVEEGVNPILDKEAMRILHKLRFRKGAKYQDKPVRLYYRLSISFDF